MKWSFGIFYRHLGFFMTIWYSLCSFGTFFLMAQEISGNPAIEAFFERKVLYISSGNYGHEVRAVIAAMVHRRKTGKRFRAQTFDYFSHLPTY
jgi:hypothetical protein